MRSGSVNVGGRMVPPTEAGTLASQEADRIETQTYKGGGGGGGGGGGSCFPGDALVRTAMGWTQIRDIEQGEKVTALDGDGRLIEREVLRAKTYGKSEIREIRNTTGAVMFRATGSHSVLTKAGWKRVDQLQKGDIVVSYEEGNEAQLTEIGLNTKVGTEETVYNLVVDGEFTFLVKGCAAHSFTHARGLQVAIWRAKAACKKLFASLGHVKQLGKPLLS